MGLRSQCNQPPHPTKRPTSIPAAPPRHQKPRRAAARPPGVGDDGEQPPRAPYQPIDPRDPVAEGRRGERQQGQEQDGLLERVLLRAEQAVEGRVAGGRGDLDLEPPPRLPAPPLISARSPPRQ